MSLSIQHSDLNGLRLIKESGSTIILPGGCGYTVNELLKQDGIEADVIRNGSEMIAPLDIPHHLVQAHKAFLNGGVDITLTDTFCAGVGRQNGDAEKVARFVRAAKAAAQIARSETGKTSLIGLSLTTSGDTHNPIKTPENTQLASDHAQNLRLLWPDIGRNADFIQVETLPTAREAEIIAELCAERHIPHTINFVASNNGDILDGTDIESAAISIRENNPYVLGIGVNCCSVEGAYKAVERLSALFNDRSDDFDGKQIIAYPNAFKHSEQENAALAEEAHACGHDHEPATLCPEEGAEIVLQLEQKGATMIGLCCGAGPDNTEAYAGALARHWAPNAHDALPHTVAKTGGAFRFDAAPHILET